MSMFFFTCHVYLLSKMHFNTLCSIGEHKKYKKIHVAGLGGNSKQTFFLNFRHDKTDKNNDVR